MPLKFRYAIFTFMLILLGQDAVSKHIAGGDFTYRRLTGNQFEITLNFRLWRLFRLTYHSLRFNHQCLVGLYREKDSED